MKVKSKFQIKNWFKNLKKKLSDDSNLDIHKNLINDFK